jgi:opine dehydrogenase
MSSETIEIITVVGAGSGGFGLITNLGGAGYRVRLHDRDGGRLEAIRARGGIDVDGGPRPFVPVEVASTDAATSVAGAGLIVLATGGNAQEEAARGLAPLLQDGQIILLVQGNTGGALVVRRALREGGCRAEVDVAEVDTYPYVTARPEPTRARIVTHKHWLQLASFPGSRRAAVMAKLQPLFPEAVPAPSVIATGFTNMNAALHVANCLANAGRIESGAGFEVYAEGVPPAVANLYQALDDERLAIAERLGAQVPSIAEWIRRAFAVDAPTLPEQFQRLTYDEGGPYRNTPTPASLAHNYIAEDVPTGLIPMAALGKAAGIPTPTLDGLIQLATVMAGRDFAADARTIERLGLAGQDAAQIRATLEDGFA